MKTSIFHQILEEIHLSKGAASYFREKFYWNFQGKWRRRIADKKLSSLTDTNPLEKY